MLTMLISLSIFVVSFAHSWLTLRGNLSVVFPSNPHEVCLKAVSLRGRYHTIHIMIYMNLSTPNSRRTIYFSNHYMCVVFLSRILLRISPPYSQWLHTGRFLVANLIRKCTQFQSFKEFDLCSCIGFSQLRLRLLSIRIRSRDCYREHIMA